MLPVDKLSNKTTGVARLSCHFWRESSLQGYRCIKNLSQSWNLGYPTEYGQWFMGGHKGTHPSGKILNVFFLLHKGKKTWYYTTKLCSIIPWKLPWYNTTKCMIQSCAVRAFSHFLIIKKVSGIATHSRRGTCEVGALCVAIACQYACHQRRFYALCSWRNVYALDSWKIIMSSQILNYFISLRVRKCGFTHALRAKIRIFTPRDIKFRTILVRRNVFLTTFHRTRIVMYYFIILFFCLPILSINLCIYLWALTALTLVGGA